MLKHSVHIELFPILWVTKLIYSESPMYPMLDKDTIKNESYQILPILFWMLSESERNSLVREIHVLGRRKLRVVVLRRPWRHR